MQPVFSLIRIPAELGYPPRMITRSPGVRCSRLRYNALIAAGTAEPRDLSSLQPRERAYQVSAKFHGGVTRRRGRERARWQRRTRFDRFPFNSHPPRGSSKRRRGRRRERAASRSTEFLRNSAGEGSKQYPREVSWLKTQSGLGRGRIRRRRRREKERQRGVARAGEKHLLRFHEQHLHNRQSHRGETNSSSALC